MKQSTKTTASLHVRDLKTREIVGSVPLSNASPRYVERVMQGMLRNMDTNRFYIDDEEVR